MKTLKILVVEDELIIAEDMRMMLENLEYEVVGIALDFGEAVEFLDQSKPDIVLSDIELGGQKDGVDLAELIIDKYKLPFIFVTSHSDKTTLERAKSMKPNGYLVKPFEQKDLYTSIEIAISNFSGSDSEENPNDEAGFIVNDAIYVKDGHALVKIFLNDLVWIKSEGNYIELHQLERRNVIRSTMQEFMEKLPTSFFRIHKSYAINLTHIDAIDGLNVKLGQDSVPLGLIINELVTNAYKYAFTNQDIGFIQIVLKRDRDGLQLTIKDTGVGMPADFELKKPKSLGMKLVNIPSRQLKGSVAWHNNKGAVFVINFRESAARKITA